MGTDAKGRRQYRYHDQWRLRRDQEKFDEMLEFARVLPGLRTTIAEHLLLADMGRARVLACVIRLLDLGFFRIGTEGYAEQNQTYGLATIRKDHVKLHRGELRFEYVAKGNKERTWALPDLDPRVYDTLRRLKARRT